MKLAEDVYLEAVAKDTHGLKSLKKPKKFHEGLYQKIYHTMSSNVK